jgi:glycerol kinase
LGREVEVAEVAEVSALGAAKLAWRSIGQEAAWPSGRSGRTYRPIMDVSERRRRRRHWAGEVSRTTFVPSTDDQPE